MKAARPRHALRRRRRPARLTALFCLTGAATLLPVAVAVAPSDGADACLSEVATGGLTGTRCDDASPPDTALLAADPTTNGNHYLRTDHVSISFSGSYTDADVDPIGFECQLYETTAAPTTWTACTSPVTYTDLEDTTEVPYTFRVRAVDSADDAIDATSPGGLLGSGADTDTADLDETPPEASFFVDTAAPNTYVFDEPFDDVTPDHPMVTQRHLTLDLASNEGSAAFVCRLGGAKVPCSGGETTLRHLAPGNQVLAVTSVDLAGNVDTTPTSTPFSVPRNLTPAMGRGWSRTDAGHVFAHDLLRATRAGATLTLEARKAKEMRVLAPRGPRLGTVEVRQGRHRWVRLHQAGTATDQAVVYQHFFNRAYTGPISFRVTRAGASRPALLDAILLH